MDDFPADVRHFILANITSVDQLEVLLLLRSSPDKEWTAAEVSRQLYTEPESAAARLADLAALGLLAVQEGGERLYRYRPRAGEQDRVVGRLADVYKQRRVATIALIYSERPNSPVQAFADAFRFRKES
jgi:hypothetical protein